MLNSHVRYLEAAILNDLQKKMVLLTGSRQVGKTTFAKHLCQNAGVYLNWDIRADQKIIRDIAEAKTFLSEKSIPEIFDRLLNSRGFPEALPFGYSFFEIGKNEKWILFWSKTEKFSRQ